MTQTKIPNKQRNEVVIKLAGREFLCRPTIEFMTKVEDICDLPIAVICDQLRTAQLRLKHAVAIIKLGIECADQPLNEDELNAAVEEAGSILTLTEVVPLVLNAFGGADKLKKSDQINPTA